MLYIYLKKKNGGGDYYLYHMLYVLGCSQTTTCSGGNVGSAGGSCGATLCVSDFADHCVPALDLS